MSKSSIEWTQMTWNPTTGCTPIKGSPACAICYAIPQSYRNMKMGLEKYKDNFKPTMHMVELTRPYGWKKPRVVFVNSMSDLFHKNFTLEFIQQVFKTMNDTPQHTYQILTKRGERLAELSPYLTWTDNIWMGVSVEDETSLERIEYLKKTEAKIKFLSIEPLFESLPTLNIDGIDWVLCGGGSGHKATPTNEEWILEIKDKCSENKVPFFFKQWGNKRFNPNPQDPTINAEHPQHAKGGCQLGGIVYREFPKNVTPNFIEQEVEQEIVKSIADESTISISLDTDEQYPLNLKTAEDYVGSLSPFKKEIGYAILLGLTPAEVAIKFSSERKMPLKTYRAYVTMVVNGLKSI